MHDIRAVSLTTQAYALTREEFHGAVKTAAPYRGQRRLAAATVALVAAFHVAFLYLGIPPSPLMLGAAAVLVVLAVPVPLLITAHAYRAVRDKGEGRCVLDGDGVGCHGAEEVQRMPWSAVTGFRETDEMFVLLVRNGRKQGILAVPKRVLTGPGEAELLGALLDERIGRR
ncbi:YcxB family protein [Streptomyces globosus]|uniref:YcxB family protein n=1 Tax=Streptomyces globosus TaxID=68209 RepID=UPI0038141C18